MPDPRFEQFAEWMRRPSFGSRAKREIELKVFELLYRNRIAEGTVTVGDELGDAVVHLSAVVSATHELEAERGGSVADGVPVDDSDR